VTSLAASTGLVPGLLPLPPFPLGFGLVRADYSTSRFEAELTRLYHAKYRSLYRYLDRVLGDDQLASDITQESFVRLLDRGSLPEDPGAWLVSVARNLMRDHYRRTEGRKRLLLVGGNDAPRPSAAADPSAAVDQEEQRREVRAALDRLGVQEREALLLRHAGYSYREIALTLDLTETNVSTILLRATASFRKVYQELYRDPA